jgi:mRNA-degrading endonuclease RelE of RelBE toxin-antitoxin system
MIQIQKEVKKMPEKEKEKIKVIIDGNEFEAEFREFKSGNKGYGLYGKVKIKDYPYRISMNIIQM